jgi:hypothetical protein
MNWRGGTIRTWIVASAIWVVYGVWRFWESCAPGASGTLWCGTGQSDWLRQLRYFGLSDHSNVVAVISTLIF